MGRWMKTAVVFNGPDSTAWSTRCLCPDTGAGLIVTASGCSDEQIAMQDSDGDGFSDEFETSELGTSPTSNDTDNDGLSDHDEVFTHGTNPNAADSDGDARSDGKEVNDGTDPNSPDGAAEAGDSLLWLLLVIVAVVGGVYGIPALARTSVMRGSNTSQNRTTVTNPHHSQREPSIDYPLLLCLLCKSCPGHSQANRDRCSQKSGRERRSNASSNLSNRRGRTSTGKN